MRATIRGCSTMKRAVMKTTRGTCKVLTPVRYPLIRRQCTPGLDTECGWCRPKITYTTCCNYSVRDIRYRTLSASPMLSSFTSATQRIRERSSHTDPFLPFSLFLHEAIQGIKMEGTALEPHALLPCLLLPQLAVIFLRQELPPPPHHLMLTPSQRIDERRPILQSF